jgi:hypothetical protein
VVTGEDLDAPSKRSAEPIDKFAYQHSRERLLGLIVSSAGEESVGLLFNEPVSSVVVSHDRGPFFCDTSAEADQDPLSAAHEFAEVRKRALVSRRADRPVCRHKLLISCENSSSAGVANRCMGRAI